MSQRGPVLHLAIFSEVFHQCHGPYYFYSLNSPLLFFPCWRFHWLLISCCCNIFPSCIHKVFPRLFRVKQQFKMLCLSTFYTLLVSHEYYILVLTEIRTGFKAFLNSFNIFICHVPVRWIKLFSNFKDFLCHMFPFLPPANTLHFSVQRI
jgi:hypothetical protein